MTELVNGDMVDSKFTISVSRAVHVCADRRLAYQVLSAFGVKTHDGSVSEVLSEVGNVKMVRFGTPLKVLWRERMLRTVERVRLTEPSEIGFELVSGDGYMRIFKRFTEQFVLSDVGGCSEFKYQSQFAVRGGVVGGLLARSVVRAVLVRFMEQHLVELRGVIEERARRSRVYPAKKCEKSVKNF